jgi:hypothetical protein
MNFVMFDEHYCHFTLNKGFKTPQMPVVRQDCRQNSQNCGAHIDYPRKLCYNSDTKDFKGVMRNGGGS